MSLKLNGVQITNCGTGIKANGKVDIEMANMNFKSNNKDIDLLVEAGSQIFINNLESTDCKFESITYEEYSSDISDIKHFVESKTQDFSRNEITKIKELLDDLENRKEEPTKIKNILKEISKIGKSTASALLIAYIKKQLSL